MPALAITLLVVAVWWVQGIGFVRRWLPALRDQPFVELVIATWFGALASLVVLLELYYVVPAATVGQLAWPVTLALAVPSVVWFARSPRGPRRLDAPSWVALAVSLGGVLLVLRPLLGNAQLGFYFSNNGEFANYAVIGDAAKFHAAATAVGGFGLRSREAVGGLHAAVISSLTGLSVFWIIQPVAAAMALLAFGALGVAFRRIALAFAARRPTLVALALVLAWAEWSASAQCFWTLSFVSQYLCVALWFGALALVLELPLDRARVAILGLTLGALACAYPEMIVPSAGLLVTAELARAPARTTLIRIAIAAGIAVVVANRLGFELVLGHTGLVPGGWNIFGDHHPALGFFAAIAGFTNPFSGPASAHAVIAVLAAIGLVAALAAAVLAIGAAPLRPLRAMMVCFAIGVAGIFALVAHHGDGNNYIALKLLLGFGWLAYLGAAVAIAQVAEHRPFAGAIAIGVGLACWIDLAPAAIRFTKQLHQASKTALYDRGDALALRAQLDAPPYVAAGWFNTYMIGAFMAYDQDVFGVDGRWPDPHAQSRVPGKWLVVVDDFDLAKDPALAGRAYTTAWQGRHVHLAKRAP